MIGVALVLNCNGNREVMVINPIGCETEGDITTKAFAAARNGYPQGSIDVVEVRANQRWFVCGPQADLSGECFWQN